MNADGSGERLFGMATMGTAQLAWSRTTNRIYFVSQSIRPNSGDMSRVSA